METDSQLPVVALSGVFSEKGWAPPRADRLGYERWVQEGIALHRIHSASRWAIGDWLRYGEGAFGEQYATGADDLGMSPEYLQNSKWLSGRFPPESRVDGLSWSHHSAVAALPPEHAQRMLAIAKLEDWSQRALVDQVRELKAQAGAIAQAASEIPEAEALDDAILDRAREIRSAQNEARRNERMDRIEALSRPTEPLSAVAARVRYPIILADPPWRYPQMGDTDRAIENHYPTLTIEELEALPVSDLGTDPGMLFMWATVPMLDHCIGVMDAWGYVYVSGYVWVKEGAPGMGHHNRNAHEHLLIGRRGDFPPPLPQHRVSSVIQSKKARHSEKPVRAYEILEAAYPGLAKVELFARGRRDGWDAWGSEV